MASGLEPGADGLYSVCLNKAESYSDDEIRDIFSQFGDISSHIHRVNNLAFVRYRTAEEAINCVDAMRGDTRFNVNHGKKKRPYRGGSQPFLQQQYLNGDRDSGKFSDMGRNDNGYGRRSDGDTFGRRSDGDTFGRRSDGDTFGRRSVGENVSGRRYDGDSFDLRSNGPNTSGHRSEVGGGDYSRPRTSGARGPPPPLIPFPPPEPEEDSTNPPPEAKVVVLGNLHPKLGQNNIYDLCNKAHATPVHVAMKSFKRHPYPKMHYALAYVQTEKEANELISSLNNLILNGYEMVVGAFEEFREEGKLLKSKKQSS